MMSQPIPWIGLGAIVAMFVLLRLLARLFEGPRTIKRYPRRGGVRELRRTMDRRPTAVSSAQLLDRQSRGPLLGVAYGDLGCVEVAHGNHTIIIDEAHERSLSVDFLLGYLARLLPGGPTSS
jgi:hypothetical protein